MHRGFYSLISLISFLLIDSNWGIAAGAPTPPLDFPVPPKQNTPWNLPEKVPDPKGKIKAAVDTLFKLGVADPRGCAYHHVTVKEDGKTVDARGWVLPAVKGDSLKHVIGWNGLIYPVEEIGKKADLAADVEILKEKGAFEEPPFDNYQEETLDKILSEFAATPRMMRAWAAPYLLLRFGYPVVVYDDSNTPTGNDKDPFAELPEIPPASRGYPTSLYLDSDHDRLVQFARLLRGDGLAALTEKNNRLAAMRLQAFDRVWAEVERRMPNEEGEHNIDPFDEHNLVRPKLNSSWRSLLVDAQRRLAPSKAVGVSEISREIATWDDVENWDLKAPPATFEKVVATGPAAIAPLLDCLEHDRRWTRASRKVEEYNNEIRVLYEFSHVRDLAICALNRILRFEVVEPFYDNVPAENSWYADATARMKMFCVKYGNACGGELWFRILSDENAEINDQLKAAKSIVRPDIVCDDDSKYSLSLLYDTEARERVDEPIRSIEGDQLRTRNNPSVLDLLKRSWKKSKKITNQDIANGKPEYRLPVTCGGSFWTCYNQAHELVILMEEWQHGNKEVLKEHYDWLFAAVTRLRKDPTQPDFLVSPLCEETLILRFWAEDKGAMPDYEKFFRSSFDATNFPIGVMKVVPEEPGMDQLAQEAFLGDKAPLSLINKPWTSSDYPRNDIIENPYHDGLPSPFLVLPSFRRALIEALQTKTKQGTLVVTKSGISVKYDADKEEPAPNTPQESTLPGTGQEVRLCDIIADLITPKSGPQVWVSPSYHLEDPLPARDRAIEAWIKVLSNHAEPER